VDRPKNGRFETFFGLAEYAGQCGGGGGDDTRQAECTAIKCVRDERHFTKDQVTLIAQPVAASGAADKEDRARNLYAWFDARA
jgi:hypothetical protein